MFFFDQMRKLHNQLQALGIEAFLPEKEELKISLDKMEESEVANWKELFIKAHLEKIKQSNGVLIANFHKNGIPGYIGANTLMEMAFAYAFNKSIFLLHEPGSQACKEEVLGLNAVVINENLMNIRL